MPHSIANAPGEDSMAEQPPPALTAQQAREWDDFQQRFFQDYREGLKREDAAAELDYQSRKAGLTVQLAQCQRERAATEKKLRAADDRIILLQEGLRELDNEFRVNAVHMGVSRKKATFDLEEHFRKSRRSGPLNTGLIRQLRRVGPSMMAFPPKDGQPDADGQENGAESSAATPDVSVDIAAMLDEPGLTGVIICRSDGTTIGEVERLTVEPRVGKNSVKLLLELPIKRTVVIREGRRFGPAEFESIHHSNDGRYSKWFSCLIQAVGDERPAPCDICSRSAGPFVSCVKVDSASPRCGNCEWSRRGCNDAEDVGAEGQFASMASSVEPDDSTAGQRPSRQAQTAKSGEAARAAKSDASGRRQTVASAPGPESTGAGSADGQPEPIEFDPEELRSPTITLRHDGNVYTHPELMAGVPLEKIDQNHPYWEPNWKEPLDLIRTTLAGHEDKYNQFLQAPKDKPHHKFFHGRQVNRGRENIQFLEEGPFHPFQIVAKRWVSPAITTYDTLHRLANTLKELAKFKITVSPADWLRQRLCEIVAEQGENFNLSATVKLLYHDPKVMALRHLSGFGNVGRPVKGMARAGASGGRKRKRKEGSSGGSPAAKRTADVSAERETKAYDEDLEYDGYTDTEATCGVSLGDDDFHLQSLRTARFTTSEEITQYWHLAPHAVLDLQLLQSVEPPEWTVASVVDGAPAEDFSVAVEDIVEAGYNPESTFVRVELRSGEVVMGSFWRERTKRRLLALLRRRGKVVRQVS